MDWRSARLLLASTVTAALVSQVVKKVYKYFTKNSSQHEVHGRNYNIDAINYKSHDINDVILFTDNVDQNAKKAPNRGLSLCESRELNCFKLLRYIKSARETLDVCMYLITSTEIAEQIVRLGQRHILVRIIVDSDMAYTSPSQIKKLQEYSFIQIQTSKKSILMHHKFCVIDGPKAVERKNKLKYYAEQLNNSRYCTKTTKPRNLKPVKAFVMSGSLNWSTQAMVSNHESVIVTSHINIVDKFEKEFESLWVENEPALMSSALIA